jgi:hypothetical protein
MTIPTKLAEQVEDVILKLQASPIERHRYYAAVLRTALQAAIEDQPIPLLDEWPSWSQDLHAARWTYEADVVRDAWRWFGGAE